MFHLITILQQSKIVESLTILKFVRDENGQFFNARADLINGSTLFVRESVVQGEGRYSYHWQTASNKLICRWDDAPHYPDVKTFPHHKHKGDEDKIEASKNITLTQVLEVIERKIKDGNW